MTDYIGKNELRYDALAKVTGKATYPADINMPNQLYAKILFSEFPHARIKKVDVSQAQIPGVIRILTAEDVPVNEYGLIVEDQPVFCGPGSEKPYSDHVRFVGDQIACVIAESVEIAEASVKLISVDYEQLPIIADPVKAWDEKKNFVHPDKETNRIKTYHIKKGNLVSGRENSSVIVESVYQTPVQEHAYLQPEAGLSYIDDANRVTVVCGGQWAHEERDQIAHALGLEKDQVRIVHPAIGGAFGGREDVSIQIVLGLAVYKLNEMGIKRPVKIVWNRTESIRGHGKRHPYLIKTTWGADKSGKLTFAEVDLLADSGAYTYTSTKVLGNAALMCTGPYEIPNVEVTAKTVYTNNPPFAAFRGFGGPQGAFAAESQMNKLAEALHIDPVEFRMRNLFSEGSELSVQSIIPKGVSIREVVKDCVENSNWNELKEIKSAANRKYGKGIACAYKNVGFSFGAPESCDAIIELHGNEVIEKAVLRHAGSEVGQGSHTVFRQMAAAALGVELDKIEFIGADTSETENSGSVSASRMTFMAGNAIRGAANQALEKWNSEERPAIAHYTYKPPITTPYDAVDGHCMPNFSYGYVAEVVELEVDTQTGEIRILNVTCSDDVGKAINPKMVEGQIEGAIVQANGYTCLENFIMDNGEIITDKLSTYLIPTILDIPERINSRIIETKDPIGPWGARGMGEMPYLPFAPAVIAAVHDATGIWFDSFPLTPEVVFNKLHGK